MQPEDILGRLIGAEERALPRKKSDRERERSCDHWTAPVLLERAAYLRKMARASEGAASDVIREFGGHRAELHVRLRNGLAETHEEFAHVFVVLDGRATLVTGGGLEEARKARPGEMTEVGIAGGESRELRAGDVVHVAAGMPHQVLVAGEKAFSYLALRIREMEERRL